MTYDLEDITDKNLQWRENSTFKYILWKLINVITNQENQN